MRKIFVLCDGGLGNRLNSLMGGLIAADKLACDPIICWPVNNWCGCAFEDLFETSYKIIDQGVTDIFLDDDKIYLTHDNQVGIVLTNEFKHSIESFDLINKMSQDIVYFHNKIPSYFSQDDIIKKIKTLKIVPHIAMTAKSFCTQYNISRKTKGVHLRKTDYPRQLDSDEIYSIILNDKENQYFVCSDEQSTEEQFSQLANVCVFPKTSYVQKLNDGTWTQTTTDTSGRIFNFNIDRPKQSVIEAFVDLLILSQTSISVRNKSTFLSWAHRYSTVEE